MTMTNVGGVGDYADPNGGAHDVPLWYELQQRRYKTNSVRG